LNYLFHGLQFFHSADDAGYTAVVSVESFAPFQELFAGLSNSLDSSSDGSHDQSHLERVWRNSKLIAEEEGGNLKLLAASVMLHDCVEVPKNSPLRGQASRLSSDRAATALGKLHWTEPDIAVVTDAVLCHSYSAGLTPRTLEGKILQDADRLDAIGMVGIARCFYTAGRMNSKLYEPADPKGTNRVLNDSSYALDHFPIKLLGLADGFQTPTGARMALARHARLHAFYDQFLAELGFLK
jgi:uncharacterized protein